MLVTDFLDQLGQATGTTGLIDDLNLDILNDELTVSELADKVNLNGLINSGGNNINGFLHSLSNHVNDLANTEAVTKSVDNVFARLGNFRPGSLR
jgi:hypothetical protein